MRVVLWRVTTVVCLSFLMLVGSAGVSLAYKQGGPPNCPGSLENLEEIVRANKLAGGGFIQTATGVQGETILRERDWNHDCGVAGGAELYGSGVTLRFVNFQGQVTSRYIHIGFAYRWGNFGGEYYGPFWEGWNGSDWVEGGCVITECLLELGGVGKQCDYRIDLGTGSNWTVRSRCGSDPFQAMHTFSSTGYTRGIAQSVTFRRGGIKTGMTDSWSGLKYRNSSDNWVNWSENALYVDTASNWHSANVTDTSYSVQRD
jgi:hypothetical protein